MSVEYQMMFTTYNDSVLPQKVQGCTVSWKEWMSNILLEMLETDRHYVKDLVEDSKNIDLDSRIFKYYYMCYFYLPLAKAHPSISA